MSIHQNKTSKKWFFRQRVKQSDGTTKNIQRGYWSTQKEAKKAEAEFTLKNDNTINDSVSFSDAYILYKEHYMLRVAIGTSLTKDRHFRNHIINLFANLPINKIEAQHILKWQDTMYAKDLSHHFMSKIQSELNQFFDFCILRFNLGFNVAKKVPPFRNLNNRPRKEFNYWTIEEFQRFFGVIENEHHRHYYISAFFLASRPGEVSILTWQDVDFENGNVDLSGTNHSKYYGGKPVKGPTKNPSSDRVVSILPQLLEVLIDYRDKRKKQDGYHPNNFIFSYSGLKPFSDSSIYRWQCKYEKQAEVPHIRRYDFRSSGIMAMFEAGMDLKSIANRVGHSDSGTTLKYYTRAVKGKEKEALGRLDSMVNLKIKV